eukprot:TRINITY_DN380_c0_g1_i2.p1 TRINITY_DN380_c0_g1~~TRINITY_DN380_c0_g1_i2.p1  ORF type:complete len:150 (+),score=11.59 TRINITY_DN380_c0_g1_i2:37-486(+)
MLKEQNLLCVILDSIRFESVNYPGRYIRHEDYDFKLQANSANDTSFLDDSTFHVRTGLWSGNSFESTNLSGYYMKHHSELLDLMIPDGSDLQKKDSSFVIITGLSGGSSVSLQSVNYPQKYVRHFDFRLRIDEDDGTALFEDDASFNIH